MAADITTARLAGHPEALTSLADWFRGEWPGWYGPGGAGCAEEDLLGYAHEGSLPVGFVAFHNGTLCGVAALKAESLPSHSHLTPWAAAGLVAPPLRGQGIGAVLLSALETEAKRLGYSRIYCGTATAASLLLRSQWRFVESVEREGKQVDIYEKAL